MKYFSRVLAPGRSPWRKLSRSGALADWRDGTANMNDRLEQAPYTGGDRRAFLRKSLVAGGLGTAGAVVSTLGVPAYAAIVSGTANQLLATRGTLGSLDRLTTGALAAANSSNFATCQPANFATANPTLAADWPSPGSITVPAFPSATFTLEITLPLGCTFASAADATARTAVRGQLSSRGGSSNTSTNACSTYNDVTLSNGNRTATGTVSFAEVDQNNNGSLQNGDTRLNFVGVRVTASC